MMRPARDRVGPNGFPGVLASVGRCRCRAGPYQFSRFPAHVNKSMSTPHVPKSSIGFVEYLCVSLGQVSCRIQDSTNRGLFQLPSCGLSGSLIWVGLD